MKKFLLSLMMTVFASIGAWADDYWLSTDTWCGTNTTLGATERCVKIRLGASGVLADAIAAINADSQYDGAKKIYINSNSGVYLNAADIQALSTLNYETIDLQDLQWDDAFTFTNSNVKNLILPDGWTKEQVNACGSQVGIQLGTALSQSSYKDGAIGTALYAYVNTPNTLFDAINRSFMDNKINQKVSSTGLSQYGLKKDNVKCLSISGYPVARDFSGYNESVIKFSEDGHFVFNQEASEDYDLPKHGVNDAEGQATRALVGTRTDGAMDGANLVELDLENAIITDEFCNDLTLSYCGVLGASTKYVKIPTTSQLTIIPADFIAGLNGISEICIPANIETIKTRAFAASVDHIWTTKAADDLDNTTWDNGLTDSEAEQKLDANGNPLLGYTDAEFGANTYGTYTFSSNLKLIERFAFSNTEPYVSDVYVLAKEAPECHVDAFGCSFYVGYSGYGVTPDASGIITRGSFKNGTNWLTMLHYPRECTTPQIQRYTDPTRVYSIATGLTDGKGAQIYFPMYGEFLAAYLQGTYGFTWKAWDTETRTNYGDVALNPGIPTNAGWSASNQATANTLFTGDVPDATFYDTTLGGNTKPEGLSDYWDVKWEGVYLYPVATSTTSYYIYMRDNNGNYVKKDGQFVEYNAQTDAGLLRYSRLTKDEYVTCNDGIYVKDYSFSEDNEGQYILQRNFTVNEEGAYVEDYEYVTDNDNGIYYRPFGAVSAPNDVWNDTYEPTDYYYPTFSYVEDAENGTWRYYWNQWTTRETFLSWDPSENALAEYDALTPSRKVINGYIQCTSREDVNNHSNELYKVSEDYVIYSSDVTDFITGVNDTKYSKNHLGTYRLYDADKDSGEARYDMEETYLISDDATQQHYRKVYSETYRLATSADEGEQRYCIETVDVVSDTEITYTTAYDYRGWHQFVLTGYAANTDVPMISYRSYMTDSDWWTICVPFDLNYNEAMLLYGDPDNNKIPYVSQLLNVVRDQKNATITLNFSENLMLHKATKDTDGNWVVSETEAPSTDKSAQDDEDIVIHQGVPYLIRPYFTNDQFDIYPDLTDYPGVDVTDISDWRKVATNDKYPGLFYKLKNAENYSGTTQLNLQKNGIVTVPALVADGSSEATNTKTVTYNGTTYPVSADWDYTFVGSFYNAMIPANSYYLGWNPSTKKATFYLANEDKESIYSAMKWINNTAVICPNLLSSERTDRSYNLGKGSHNGEVTKATGSGSSARPAQWIINSLVKDDLGSASGANGYGMNFGGFMYASEGANAIQPQKVLVNIDGNVYTLDGRMVSESTNGLSKGVYIQNGKKIIVK